MRGRIITWDPTEVVRTHKWIYIEAHVKGPDHLPVIVKDRVHKLVR